MAKRKAKAKPETKEPLSGFPALTPSSVPAKKPKMGKASSVPVPAAKAKALDAALKGMQKAFGKHAIGRIGDMEPMKIEVIPTGSLNLDIALGIGGVPRGRIVEIYGPESSGKTSLCLEIIANVHKAGGEAVFIDAEHALDIDYAAALGVDADRLILAQPDNGEQALELVEQSVASGAVDLVVVDSVSALVPRAEIDGDMGDSHVGLQARLLSQACRKLAGIVKNTNTTLIFINQLRMKIGVMFGCFHYNSRVVLANGTTEKIGKIVNQRLPVEVMSFDPETGECRPRKVIDWHDNGNADFFLQFEVEGIGGSGTSRFGVTPNHMIFTPKGEVAAGELSVGDDVWGKGMFQFNESQRQVALGSVLGDGSLRKTGRHTVSLRIGHGANQLDYARWKKEILGDSVGWSGKTGSEGWGFDTKTSCDLLDLHEESYTKQGRKVGDVLASEIDLPGLAVWYMDDACFSGSYEKWGHGKVEISIKSYKDSESSLENLLSIFERLGLPKPTVNDTGTRLLWSGERTKFLQEALAPYIHPSMAYKIHPRLRGLVGESLDETFSSDCDVRHKMLPVKITDIYVKPPTRSMKKFDLTVEGDHTYIVSGVGVHNSPETTTGGKALKFYSSIRIDIRRIGSIKQGDQIIGNQTRVKVVKNKMAAPFKQAEFEIHYGKGISYAGEVTDYAVKKDLIAKSGAWYSVVGNEKIRAQGRSAFLQLLEENPEVLEELAEKVRPPKK